MRLRLKTFGHVSDSLLTHEPRTTLHGKTLPAIRATLCQARYRSDFLTHGTGVPRC